MIFCWYGLFLENSLSKQNFPSPHMLAVCIQGDESVGGRVFPFFPKILLRLFKILLGARLDGKSFVTGKEPEFAQKGPG